MDSSLTVGKIAPRIESRGQANCYSLVPIFIVVAFSFMQFDDFYALFLAANACCYFGNRDVDQTKQGSGM